MLKRINISVPRPYTYHQFIAYRNDNAELYTIKTSSSYNSHPPLSHLTKYQKGVHYAGIRIFNQLPTSIKSIANETKEFKKAFKSLI